MPTEVTRDLAEASRRVWDVMVIGAGPAGAVAARALALRGAAVLLVDKAIFPRPKVCGCCLNDNALASLDALGLGSLTAQHGAKNLSHLQIAAAAREAVVPIHGQALSRAVFDAALVQAASVAGAHFLPGTSARLDASAADRRMATLHRQGQSMPVAAKVVLSATGLGGKLADDGSLRTVIDVGSRLGAGVVAQEFPDFFEPGRIFMACGQGGYVGLVRIEDGRLNLAAAFDGFFVKVTGGLGNAAAATLREAGFPGIAGLGALPWHGTPLLTRRVARPGAERVLLLGDAAGYVEPFTGEGMAWALAAGAAVAPLALEGVHRWDASLVGRWTHVYRQTVMRRQWVCRAVAQVLRRPALVRLGVAALARFPLLAAPFIRYLNQKSIIRAR